MPVRFRQRARLKQGNSAMFLEHLSQPLITRAVWWRRVFRSIGLGLSIIGGALLIGIIGYHLLVGLSLIDAFLESAMILSGMGAIAPMSTDSAKLFAGCYALFCGFVAMTSSGIVLAPWLHRMLHHMHEKKS